MDSGLKKTLVLHTTITLVLLVAGLGIYHYVIPQWYYPFFPFLMLFFYLVNFGVFIMFYRSLRKPDNQFIRMFMGSTGGKLMVYLILLLVYIMNAPKTSVSFAVSFSVLYIVYTALDLFIMVTLVKRPKEKTM
jgi:hypothetical protein